MEPTTTEPRGRLCKLLDARNESVLSLMTRGYAIVVVTNPERARELANSVWTDLESLQTGIQRSDPATWKNDKWPQTTHGLLQNQQWGLMTGTCESRLETLPFWESMFAGKRVISSFDAVAVCRPASQQRTYNAELKNQQAKNESVLLSSWLHTDQAKCKTQCLEHIQGAFALTDLGESEQRTQLVVPRGGETAQSFRDRFIAAFPPDRKSKRGSDAEREEWIKHSDAERLWLLQNGQVVAPTLRAGEMLLWDSGVPHASIPGRLAPPSKTRSVRMSVFVSALPLELVDEQDLKLRQKMLEQGDTSGHRVTSRGARTGYRQCKFSKVGRTYNKPIPTFSTERVVSGFKRAFDAGEDSISAKIARMCGGY